MKCSNQNVNISVTAIRMTGSNYLAVNLNT